MRKKLGACFLIDRHSFPKKCDELQDFMTLVKGSVLVYDVDSPTSFFRKALQLTDDYELVVPVTRNLFVRDRLRQEGVNLIICL